MKLCLSKPLYLRPYAHQLYIDEPIISSVEKHGYQLFRYAIFNDGYKVINNNIACFCDNGATVFIPKEYVHYLIDGDTFLYVNDLFKE